MTLAREIQNTRPGPDRAGRRRDKPWAVALARITALRGPGAADARRRRSLHPDRTRGSRFGSGVASLGRGRLEPAATTHSGVCCAAGRGLSGASGLLRPWQLAQAKRADSDCRAFGRQVAGGPGPFLVKVWARKRFMFRAGTRVAGLWPGRLAPGGTRGS